MPDILIFHYQRQIAKVEMRSKLYMHMRAFECSGSWGRSTTTVMGASMASSEYVEAEWMIKNKNDDFPQSENYLWGEAMKFAKSEQQLSQAHKIQQAYREWCEYYQKTPNKDRLGVFASNFMAVKDYHERTGRPLIMNEFSDLTEKEWKELQQQKQQSRPHDPSQTTLGAFSTSDKPLQSDRIRKAYWEWCHYYGKTYDEKRLKAFTINFLAVEKYHQQTNKELVLNEFADMSELEYQNYLKTTAHFVTAPDVMAETTPYHASPTQTSPNLLGHSNNLSHLKDSSSDDPITTALPASSMPQSLPISQKDSSIESSSMFEVMSALQSTVEFLSGVVNSMNRPQLPTVSPPQLTNSSSDQPLDSLVIDVLKEQDSTIADLLDSVDGLRDVQEQSGSLIQLVSQNQMQMAEMMTTVQAQMTFLQEELKLSKEETRLLTDRIRVLEEILEINGITEFYRSSRVSGPLSESGAPKETAGMSSLARATNSRNSEKSEKIVIEPNPIGLGMCMFTPQKPSVLEEDPSKAQTTSSSLENKRRSVGSD
jgi:hypothetical protein